MPLIAKVVDGENLTAKEAEKVFTNIFLYDKDALHFSTFVAAIHAKSETSDELLGLCQTHGKLGEKLNPKIPANKITDVSGTGGGSLKTFNVSTTVSFIVAAAGYAVAKKSYYAVTSPTGSADIFNTFGIDIAKLRVYQIEKTLEETRICPFYLPFISPKLKNRGSLFKKVFLDAKIKVTTPFHLVTNAYAPMKMKYRIYGCYSDRHLEILGELFYKLGFEKTLTLHGVDGLPEVSNTGKTIVVEQKGKKLTKYTLNPNDLGVKKAKAEQIKTGGKEQNIIDFLRILQGKEKGSKKDLAAINAAASLYVMGETKSIAEAVPKAQEIIKSGEGFRVLEKLVKARGNPKLLKTWSSKI